MRAQIAERKIILLQSKLSPSMLMSLLKYQFELEYKSFLFRKDKVGIISLPLERKTSRRNRGDATFKFMTTNFHFDDKICFSVLHFFGNFISDRKTKF